MHILSVLLVIIGLVALVLSLLPLTAICRHETGHRLGWRGMFGLVFVFIFGYSFYCYHLMFKTPSLIDFILAGIFAGGGFFVVLVSRMSLASLNKLQSIALEHEKQTLHDLLTGLPNRKSLMLTLANTVAASGRGDAHFAIMVMDLNGFKNVNDTLGHHAGDVALQIIAPRLNDQLRASDTLCRMGGDEFCVILPQANKDDAEQVAKKMLAACTESMMVDDNNILLGISIGIALSPDHACGGDTLIQYADKAMYQAKQHKTGFEFYDKEIDNQSVNRLSDAPEILQALKDKQLMLYFQPVFSKEELSGLEVSLSWHKLDGSIVGAQDFLQSLVYLGASWPLIEYVVDSSFLSFSDWKKQTGKDINLRLNLFIGGLDKEEFCDYLESKAHQHKIPTKNIVIEVPECLSTRHSVITVVNNLRSKGFKISLDEFGGNGARLLSLKNSVLDEVKLGYSLVSYSGSTSFDEAIIKCIKAYCDQMNVSLVASGIDDPEVLNKLKDLGVQAFQGDVLCPFIPAIEMNEWLIQQKFQSVPLH